LGRHRRSALASCCVLVVAACAPAASPASLGVVETRTVDVGHQSSGPIGFTVPDDGVALSVLVRSTHPETLVQLEHLAVGGMERIGGAADDVDRMAERHDDHEIIETPTGFVHEVQRHTYSFTYPFAPGWDLPPGPGSISMLVDRPDSLHVEIVVLRAGDRLTLPITVFSPGKTLLSGPARQEVERILAAAGVEVRWGDGVLPSGTPSRIDDIEDRTPASDVTRLATAVRAVSSGGVNVVMLDHLPGGLSGFATGVPGPHDGSGMAVAVAFRSPTETARTVAHEVAHLLGLRHLEDRSASGVVVRNPIADTAADAYNLMQFGSNLTVGQIEILLLSPLLEGGT
jgi:hypothetical protein